MTKRTYVANNKKYSEQNGSIKESVALENGYLHRTKVDNRNMLQPYEGLEAAKQAFENGSEEVRQLLLHECALIYECQFCRNMFRSVTDFLNHKRNACQMITNKYKHESKSTTTTTAKTTTTTVNTQTDYEVCNVSTCTSPIAAEESTDTDKDTVTTVQQQHQNQTDFGAKYPELHNLLFPKAVEQNTDNVQPQNDVNSLNLNTSVHIARCRFSATYVFQCPQCPLVFVQPAAAMKHMMKIHNRPRLGLRMLREAILKRRIQLNENSDSPETKEEENCHCAYCKEVFKHNIDLSIHLLYCSVKDIVLQRRRVHFRHHSADYIRTAIEESKGEHLDTTIPLDFSELWPISRQKLTKARKKLKQMEARRYELIKKTAEIQQNNSKANDMTVKIKIKETTTMDKIKRKKEKREKKEKKRAQKTLLAANESSNLPVKDQPRLTRQKSLENNNNNNNNNKKSTVDETTSFSSCLSIESSENESNAMLAASPVKHNPCRCKICNKKFDGLGNVRRHISMYHYRANRFGCKLCTYRAFRRYDIVNHLGFVHKICEAREVMAVQYVVQHEVQNNLDVDDDIEMLSVNSEEVKTMPSGNKTGVGRVRKSELTSIDKIVIKTTDKKKYLKRKAKASSQCKRPIRNRIKPVDKDFVYDEDSKDNQANVRCLRKRQGSKSEEIFVFTTLLADHALPKIKGAAARLLSNLVAGGLASAASAPELPLERPKMRPHVSDMSRDGMQAGRVIEAQELEQARLKSTLLDDTFLAAKINQIKKCSTNKHNFRVKPSLAKEVAKCSMTRNLLMKVTGESVITESSLCIKQENDANDATTVKAQLQLMSTESNSNFNELLFLQNIKQERDEEMNEDVCIPQKRIRVVDVEQEQKQLQLQQQQQQQILSNFWQN